MSELEFPHYFGPYGTAEMILPLIDKLSQFFCRSSSGHLVGSICDHYSAMWTTRSIWLLDATDERRLHGIHTTGLDGGPIIG